MVRREAINLDIDVLLVPEEGNSRQPILLFDRPAGERPVFGRKYPCRGREIRAGNFASDSASCNSHLGIIPDALVFPGVAARLYVKLVVLLSKPDGRRYGGTAFAESGEADVFLALNFARDGHRDYCTGAGATRCLRLLNVVCSVPTWLRPCRNAQYGVHALMVVRFVKFLAKRSGRPSARERGIRMNSWQSSRRSGRSGHRFPCADLARYSPAWRETF